MFQEKEAANDNNPYFQTPKVICCFPRAELIEPKEKRQMSSAALLLKI
jgi:hypothetical protein